MDGLTLKHNDLFLFCAEDGDLNGDRGEGHGLYHRDTRHLAAYRITAGGRPLRSVSAGHRTVWLLEMEQTNGPDSTTGAEVSRTLHVERERLVERDLQERLRLTNTGPGPLTTTLEISAAADFADIFQVRGARPARRGQVHRPRRDGQQDRQQDARTRTVEFSYSGLDGVERRTRMEVRLGTPGPTWLGNPEVSASTEMAQALVVLTVTLEPGATACLDVSFSVWSSIAGNLSRDIDQPCDLDEAKEHLAAEFSAWKEATRQPPPKDLLWRQAVDQGLQDLRVLLTDLGHGPFVTAGVPWFAVPFGRDSIIAALQLLPFNADVAKGTLRTLAALQGTRLDPVRDEAPGKILHEMRQGEMAALGQVPFGRYYGSVDSTPLFLMLLAETFEATRDVGLYRELLPAAERALDWCERYGDLDGDGYLEYHRQTAGGLANQGWKDSGDSVSHQSGELAMSPIALCEVQGYYYAALLGMSRIYRQLAQDSTQAGSTGDAGASDAADTAADAATRSQALANRADALKRRFNRDFWLEDEGFVALGLDREKRRIATVASNAGHCLWTGILTDDHAAAVADRLLAPDLFSGWGLRTLSSQEKRYGPVSYHNGSVWPHDTAIAVLGLARNGHTEKARRLATALIEASAQFPMGRLPELFSGEPRDGTACPKPYPQACSPQAWAAGAPLMLWQALHARGGEE